MAIESDGPCGMVEVKGTGLAPEDLIAALKHLFSEDLVGVTLIFSKQCAVDPKAIHFGSEVVTAAPMFVEEKNRAEFSLWILQTMAEEVLHQLKSMRPDKQLISRPAKGVH